MTLPCKMAGVLAVLLVLNAAPPAKADEPDKYQVNQIETLKRQIKDLRQQRDLDELDRKAMQLRLDRIEEQLARLERLARLSDQSSSRTARSFDPSPRTGTIRIQNDLDVTATVTIDGTAYVVRPGVSRYVSRPAGSVRYYVTADGFSVGPLNRSVVRADETLTITVYDTRLRRRFIDE
jgi:hypothetical protein